MSCGNSCDGCDGCSIPSYREERIFTDIVVLNKDNFNEEAYDDPAIVVIDFWAPWCGPCRMLAPIFEELNAEYPHLKFCRINVDEQPELAQTFNIESIPTVIVLHDHHAIAGSIGLRSKEELREMLDNAIKG